MSVPLFRAEQAVPSRYERHTRRSMGATVVTGAAQGIGKAVAARLLGRGDTVWCVDTDRLAAVAADFSPLPGIPIVRRCDVGDADDIDALWRDIDATGARVSALVNNAGIFLRSSALDTRLDDWNLLFAVNLTGGFLM